MSRRLERLLEGRVDAVGITAVVVPGGEKWTVRELLMMNTEAGPHNMNLTRVAGGLPFYLDFTTLGSLVFVRRVLNTPLYAGETLQMGVATAFAGAGQVDFTVSGIKLLP